MCANATAASSRHHSRQRLGRIQTVSADENPDFHALLRAVGCVTGREMVLNTSFNVKGQPIVNTPREAIDTFLRAGIEYLFLENTQICRNTEKQHESSNLRCLEGVA